MPAATGWGHWSSVCEMGKDIDYSSAAIGNILAGKSNPNFDFVAKLMNLYPMLDGHWLILGKGDMFIDPNIRPKSLKSYPPDLLEAKNEIIRLQNENMQMKDEKIRQLTEELGRLRRAGN